MSLSFWSQERRVGFPAFITCNMASIGGRGGLPTGRVCIQRGGLPTWRVCIQRGGLPTGRVCIQEGRSAYRKGLHPEGRFAYREGLHPEGRSAYTVISIRGLHRGYGRPPPPELEKWAVSILLE